MGETGGVCAELIQQEELVYRVMGQGAIVVEEGPSHELIHDLEGDSDLLPSIPISLNPKRRHGQSRALKFGETSRPVSVHAEEEDSRSPRRSCVQVLRHAIPNYASRDER